MVPGNQKPALPESSLLILLQSLIEWHLILLYPYLYQELL